MPKVLASNNQSALFVPQESRLRLQTIVRLRWFAVAGQLLAIAIIRFGYGFPLPVGPCLMLIALSAWLNVFLRIKFVSRHRLSNVFATTLLAYDILQLAVLLYLTGGIQNPFIVLIVAPVTVSAATLPGRSTILLGTIALLATALLSVVHWPLPWAGAEPPVMPPLYRFGTFAAIVACTIFLAIYARRLSSEARQMSVALTATELVLAREQQLHALDGLAAAAAHELGTPLATIVLVSKEMGRDLPPDSPMQEDLELLRTQAQRCREILQKLTQQPTGRDPMHASMTLAQVIDEAVEPHRATGKSIVVSCAPLDPDGDQRVPDAERHPGLLYGLGNLVENAVDFAKSRVDVSATWTDEHVSVVIADDGPGFAPDIIDTIGDPYVTTRPSHGGNGDEAGLGLGFFIAKTLLERSGAALEFDNRMAPASGAIVRITWPRAAFTSADSSGAGVVALKA
ncbi:MAG: ActS/PrrB/RegB family redox-sensitive histidine kinase [Hyphomicrobiaceae bacterium]|nr:ActS/PrrB/RegB family redox-sensitive histidine kinase [Hyphomicrobiaceae bacterium]